MKKASTDLSTTIAFWTPRVSLSILLAVCFSSTAWGQVKKAEIVGTPSVKEDRVTIRIKVTGNDDRPVVGLEDTNFGLIVDGKQVPFKNKDWKSSNDSVPPPAWIIVLLDYSGSMKEKDKGGTSKLEGAINAVREVSRILTDRGANTQLSIVPFGEPGPGCKGNPVTKDELDKFFPVNDFKLSNYLDYLAHQVPCAATNIYEPLSKAVRFLGNSKDERFYLPEDSQEPQPRLSVIVLSDGYQNTANEAEEFKKLIPLLKRNNKIIVHTLGYGSTPQQLAKQYGLKKPATRADIGKGEGKVPEEEFVDEERLKEIAQTTGGIAEFSTNAEDVAEKLKLFLAALLGEYEITYTEPNPDRGSKHDVRAVVQSPTNSSVQSEPKSYSIGVFGPSLPFNIRLIMVLSALVIAGVGGVIPFWAWAQALKREALET